MYTLSDNKTVFQNLNLSATLQAELMKKKATEQKQKKRDAYSDLK